MEITTYLLSSQYLIPTPPQHFFWHIACALVSFPGSMDHLCVGYLSPPLLIFVRVITTSEPASEVPIPPHPWGRLCHIVVCRISLCLALRIPSKTVRGRCDWNSLQPLLATSWVLSHQREKEEKSSWHLLYIIGASCGVALLYGFEPSFATR